MSNAILCQVRRAETPYYIEEADLKVGSLEELCYYLQNNLSLVDLSFFSTKLLDWMTTELGALQLVQDLHHVLTEIPDPQLPELIMPVMREAGWLNDEEDKQMRAQLRAIDALPVVVRLKQRADSYVQYKKYARAIKTYDMILKLKQTEKLGHPFSGTVWHNKGVAHARLFQMEEASSCMRQAYDQLHTMQSLRSLLFCVRMSEGEDAFRREADALGVDPGSRDALAAEIRGIELPKEPEDPDGALEMWVKEYRRETEV